MSEMKAKRVSLRKSINEYCRSCIYDKANKGNFVQQVSMCPVLSCPLWECRPVSQKWGKTIALHDKETMEAWSLLTTDYFYRRAVELSGEDKL